MADQPKTNISEWHKAAFGAVQRGENIALVSCECDGEPTATIAAVKEEDDGSFRVTPLFVAVTPRMKLVDHDGREPNIDFL
jgi:hypothetical protein